jgi:ABC-2 type transport system ATP-binding protein
MDEAEYCHRLALMYRGKFIALGPPAELKRALDSRALLYLETSDPLESMKALEGEETIGEVAVFGAGLHVTISDFGLRIPTASGQVADSRPDAPGPQLAHVAERIRARLAGRGTLVRRLEAIAPSMEDVFVAMIEEEERKAL